MKIYLMLISFVLGPFIYSQEFKSLADCTQNNCDDYFQVPLYDFNYLEHGDPKNIEIDEKPDFSSYEQVQGLDKELSDFLRVATTTEFITQEIKADDKKKHYRAGAMVGYFSAKACKEGIQHFRIRVRNSQRAEFFCALAGASFAGVAKELYDMTDPHNHSVDVNDAIATSLGAFSTIPLFKIEF